MMFDSYTNDILFWQDALFLTLSLSEFILRMERVSVSINMFVV